MKVKIDLPQFDNKNNSQNNDGVKLKNTNNSRQVFKKTDLQQFSKKNNQTQAKFNHSNKHLNSKSANANIKTVLNGNMQLLGNQKGLNFSSNTNVRLNSNSPSFSIGLQQNAKITISLLFQVSPPQVQNLLKDFTSHQIVSSLFLSGGITAETGNSKNLSTVINTPIFRDLISLLSKTIPTNQPIQDVRELWNNCGSIFSDSGCSKVGKDLETVAIKYSKIFDSGDLKTLVKLAEILQKGENKPELIDKKLLELVKQIISKGEKTAIIQAQKEINLVSTNEQFLKTAEPNKILQNLEIKSQNQELNPKRLNAAEANNLKLNEQIVLSTKDTSVKSDFYSEKTELAMRKQLDYYPHYAYDQQISKFENSNDLDFGKNMFLQNHYDEIETWLESGKHRLVKDFEFDKPLGMIVDRAENGFITADKIRVLLVRDGSVDGWHVMKSFLVC